MTPENLPLTARRNVHFLEEYVFSEDGVAVDLTGYTGALQVRQEGANPTAIISLSNVASNIEGVWVKDPTAGVLQVKINEATLATAYSTYIGSNEAGSDLVFAYDLVLTAADSFQETFLEGTFTLKPGVTV